MGNFFHDDVGITGIQFYSTETINSNFPDDLSMLIGYNINGITGQPFDR